MNLQPHDQYDRDAVAAVDPATAPNQLRRIVLERPDLHVKVAVNPGASTDTLELLARSSDPAVLEALAYRSTHQNSTAPAPSPPLPGGHMPPAMMPAPIVHPGAGWPPVQTPGPHRSRMKLAAIIVAVVLVIGIGVVAAWRLWWSQSHTISLSLPATPSNEWAKGAQQVWEVPIDMERGGSYVVSDTILRFGPDGLAAYGPLDPSMKQLWHVPFSVEDVVGEPDSLYPFFKAWGENSAIYGNQVIDLASGEVATAPWSKELPLYIAGSVAISCDGDKCSAWEAGKLNEALWEATVTGADSVVRGWEGYDSSGSYQPIIDHNGVKYVILGGDVVNLETGETLPFDTEADSRRRILPASDGWLVVSGFQFKAYTIEGKPLEDFEVIPAERSELEPVLSASRLASLEELKQSFENPAKSALAVEAGLCIDRFVGRDFTEFNSPAGDKGCFRYVIPSEDFSVFVAQHHNSGDNGSIDALVNTHTGQLVEFPGVDMESVHNGVFSVSPDLILVKDYQNNRFVAYSPKS